MRLLTIFLVLLSVSQLSRSTNHHWVNIINAIGNPNKMLR